MVTVSGYGRRPVIAAVVCSALLTCVAAGLKGHTREPADQEGRQPGSLVVTVPASLLLPSLATDGFPTSSGWHFPPQAGSLPPQEDIPVDLNHLQAEEQLQRFFSYFQLPPGACQERLICELNADLERFQPASGVFLRALAPYDLDPAAPDPGYEDSLDVEGDAEVTTRLQRLRRAAKSPGDCGTRFASCPFKPEQLISESALYAWRWVAALTSVTFSTLEL